MPKKKTPAEETPEPAQTYEEPEDMFSRFDPAKIVNPETMGHLLKAGMELMQAMEKSMPRDKVPAEVKVHYKNMKREFLLMSKAMIDHKLKEMDRKQGEAPAKLRKIELQ
ncbi:MAG TPA: hypothetical protein VLH13_04280 [Methanomassiliicoccales archaeon]|nr:hypothetical protein [Methanomassiliicoccales archaeon]